MIELQRLRDRIIQRVNINLRELDQDVEPLVRDLVPLAQMGKFHAFYAITPFHPLNLAFQHSNLAGSYFLGKVAVNNSLVYKSDVRGDELKKKGGFFRFEDQEIQVQHDERIEVDDSFLIKTLVHCFSHDPEALERFFIRDTVSTHYANIHGSPCKGCFLGPFATVDLTTLRDCVVGTFSYIQAGEITHMHLEPGTVWVRSPHRFNFLYRHPLDRLNRYIYFAPGAAPQGVLMDFVGDRKEDFSRIFNVVNVEPSVPVPDSSSLDRFAVIKPKTTIGENVLVAQRAYLQDASLGKGANAQENCYLINTTMEGYDVTAHGAKLIDADLAMNVFVGFNSFLRGRPDARLRIGAACIVMPHTIIDVREPLSIPAGHLVWGLITCRDDLALHSMSLDALAAVDTGFSLGNLYFEGSGAAFVTAFQDRIHHILEANGAFFDGEANSGHAQRNQNLSFNMLQPYPDGDRQGLYPTILIQP